MNTLDRLAREHPLVTFFMLAYAIAWLAWAPLVLSRSGIGLLPFELPLWYILPGSYAPLAAALLTQWSIRRDLRIGRLAPSARKLVAAILIGAFLIVLAFVLLPSLYLTGGSMNSFKWAALAGYPYGTVRAIAMAGPIGEEPGWRGFALPRLQALYRPTSASLILGLLWAGWHLPLFLVSKWESSPLWIYGPLILALGFTINCCFNLSGGSVLLAVVLHGVFNASSGILGGFLADAEIRSEARPDLVIALCFLAVGLFLAATTRGRLWRKHL